MEQRSFFNVPKTQLRVSIFCAAASGWEAPYAAEINLILSMAGWSQREAAERLGVSTAVVQQWGQTGNIPYAAWCVICQTAGFGRIWDNKVSHAKRN